MEAPIQCDCGEMVCLFDTNPCETCNKGYCEECCKEPWSVCVYCDGDSKGGGE